MSADIINDSMQMQLILLAVWVWASSLFEKQDRRYP